MASFFTRSLSVAGSWLLIGCVVTQASSASPERDAPLPLPQCGDGVLTVRLKSGAYRQPAEEDFGRNECTYLGEPGATIIGGLHHLAMVRLRGSIHFEGGQYFSYQTSDATNGNLSFVNVSFSQTGGLLFYNSSVLFDQCAVQVGDNHEFYAESSTVTFISSALSSQYVGELVLQSSIIRYVNTSVTTFDMFDLNRSSASFEGPGSRVVGPIDGYRLGLQLVESALTFDHGDAAIAPGTSPYDPLAPDRVSVQSRSHLVFGRCTSLGSAMPNVSFSVSGDSEVTCSPGKSPSRILGYVAPAAMYI